MEDLKQNTNDIRGKIISIVLLVLILITIRYMLDLALLTFILSFLFYHIVTRIQKQSEKKMPFHIPDAVVLSIVYALFIGFLVILSNEALPKLADQVMWVANEFIRFDYSKVEAVMSPSITKAFAHIDFNYYISQAGVMMTTTATKAGSLAINFFIAMILSFVILLEKNTIKKLGANMATSRISFIYGYFLTFGGSFCKTFGKVMSVQVLIAFINCIISMICLKIIGFESILGIGFMVFFLGLIPVAGVIISLVPLCIIAFSIGGVIKVVQVIVMILVIHAIEAYILNPKLMSHKTRLPVCFTFIILLVSQHYLGVWGLLIGVPIFIFLMDILEVDYEVDK